MEWMFEITKMEQEFDYSIVDNETADFLRSCEYEMNGIAEDARVKFGGVLKRAQDKLANHHGGVFVKWYESGGLNKNDVYYCINLHQFSTNLENTKRDNFLNAPKSLQKEVMKKSAPDDLKEGVFDGDIKTHKEYKDMLKEKKQVEQQLKQVQQSEQQAIRQLEELEGQPPKVVEKQVVKEIDNTDYSSIENLQKQKKSIQQQYDELKEYMDTMSEDIEEFQKVKGDLESLYSQKDDLHRQISSATSLSELHVDIEYLLTDKLAPIRYSKAITEARDSKVVINNLREIVEMVEEWAREIAVYLPDENIIDVEVI